MTKKKTDRDIKRGKVEREMRGRERRERERERVRELKKHKKIVTKKKNDINIWREIQKGGEWRHTQMKHIAGQ